MSHSTISIPVEDLALGSFCSRPITDDAGVLLLGSNTRLTEHLISGLLDRGITHVEVDRQDVSVLQAGGRTSRRAPGRQSGKRQTDDEHQRSPLKRSLVDRYESNLDSKREQRLATMLSWSSKHVDAVGHKLRRKTLRNVFALIKLSKEHVQALIDDHDHTVGCFGRVDQSDALPQRSTRMAVLGMAVAAEMGLSVAKASEVGLTGLLHDVGLLTMSPSLRQPQRWTSDDDQWEYQKHPLVAAECLKNLIEISPNVSLAITQVHEQIDGSGFPRGLGGNRIHPYAKILNVVDAYLQLTTTGIDQPPLVPHDAMALLLHQAAMGKFDPSVMRALLNAKSLFPLGSQVQLSTGEAATVIRRPRTGYSKPVLLSTAGKRVELEDANVHVVRPLIPEGSSAVRVDKKMLQLPRRLSRRISKISNH